jgi:hypothetical protein
MASVRCLNWSAKEKHNIDPAEKRLESYRKFRNHLRVIQVCFWAQRRVLVRDNPLASCESSDVVSIPLAGGQV